MHTTGFDPVLERQGTRGSARPTPSERLVHATTDRAFRNTQHAECRRYRLLNPLDMPLPEDADRQPDLHEPLSLASPASTHLTQVLPQTQGRCEIKSHSECMLCL